MIKDQLEKLKTSLMNSITDFGIGFANVSKPDGTNYVVDDKMQYVGISDEYGNYFYLRSLKETTYRPYVRGCRIQSYASTTQCRLVSITKGIDEELHMMMLIDTISKSKYEVIRSVSEKTRVFFEETGNREMTDVIKDLNLLSIDFNVVGIVDTKNCKPQTCIC